MLVPVYRRRALLDLESIAIYLGEVLGMPDSAQSVTKSTNQAVMKLCEFPDLGRPFSDESLEGLNYRTFLVGNYRIVYTVLGLSTKATRKDFNRENSAGASGRLTVWRVFHTRQDIDDFSLVALYP